MSKPLTPRQIEALRMLECGVLPPPRYRRTVEELHRLGMFSLGLGNSRTGSDRTPWRLTDAGRAALTGRHGRRLPEHECVECHTCRECRSALADHDRTRDAGFYADTPEADKRWSGKEKP